MPDVDLNTAPAEAVLADKNVVLATVGQRAEVCYAPVICNHCPDPRKIVETLIMRGKLKAIAPL